MLFGDECYILVYDVMRDERSWKGCFFVIFN